MDDQGQLVYRAPGAGGLHHESEESTDLLEAIYLAARHRRRWQDVLAVLVRRFGGVAAFVAHHDLSTGSRRVLFRHGLSSPLLDGDGLGDDKVTELFGELVGACPSGAALRDADICPESKIAIARKYEDLRQRVGVGSAILGVIEKSPKRIEYIFLARGVGAERFRIDDVDEMSALLPHLRYGLAIFHELSKGKYLEQGTMLALNHLPYAMIIVSRKGRPIAKNEYGEQLLRSGDGIRNGPNGLEFTQTGSTISVKQLLGDKRKRSAAAAFASSDAATLIVDRKHAERPLCVMIFPLGDVDDAGFAGMGGLVLIADPARRNGADITFLSRAFGLTPAEARVAEVIVNGGRVTDAPGLLGISVGTARTHLKRIFSKTGAFSQADLVRLAICYSSPRNSIRAA